MKAVKPNKKQALIAKVLVLCLTLGLVPAVALGLSSSAPANAYYENVSDVVSDGSTAEVEVDATVSNGTATANVGSTALNKAVDTVVAEAAKDESTPVVVITLDSGDKEVTGMRATLPTSSLKKLAEAEGALVVESEAASIDLDSDAVKALAAVSGTATVSATPVAATSLTEAQKVSVGDGTVYDFSITVGGKAVDFGTATLTVKVALPEGVSAAQAIVWYLKDDGNVEYCPTGVSAGEVTFTTTHFSKYVIDNLPFTDVAEGDYLNAIKWAADKKVTTGATETTFNPNGSCTRAQIVTFLWRAAGSPTPTSTENPFTDVDDDAYYADAVLWAVEKGITTGMSDTTFEPDTTCTRAQAVTFLYRNAAEPEVAADDTFVDVDADAYYADAVAWAVANKVTEGTSTTTFSPAANCTRAQIVTFLYRDLVD